MAYGKKYFTSYKSYNGWDYYLEIWVDGYSSSITEITLGEGGPVISYDTDKENRFSPINSSKLELPFMVTNIDTDNFIKDIKNTFNERDVYVHLYKGTSSDYTSEAPLWSGFVLMDLSATPDKFYPYPVKLTAVDGLALLKEKDWVKYTSYDTPANTPGNYDTNDRYYGPAKFTHWLKEILFKTGMSTTGNIACGGITPPNTGVTEDYQIVTAVNWYNAAMPDTNVSSDPLDLTKCSMSMMYNVDANENITPVNTYNVLENILRHWGARITYWKHKFYIVQIPEYITDETGTATNPDNINSRTYTLNAGVVSSQDNLGSTYWTRYQLPVNGTLAGGIRKLSGGTFDYMPKLKQVTAQFIDYGNRNYYGGFPFGVDPSQTPYAPSSLVFQDEIAQISNVETLKLNIPLDVELNTNDFQWAGNTAMKIYFNFYFTNDSTTYYLIFDKYNTPQYYWSTQRPEQITASFNRVRPFWYSFVQHTSAVQTLVGFDEDLEFKDSSGSNLSLTGSWKFFLDIEPWGANGETTATGSLSSSFRLFNAFSLGPGGSTAVISPFTSAGVNYISWTNSLLTNSQPLNPTDIGSTTPGVITTINGNITFDYTPGFVQNPFQGQLLFISNVVGATYGSQLFEIDPNGAEVETEDLGQMIWGDSLMSTSQGSLQVWNGSAFQKSSAAGQWGVGTITGTDSFTRILLQQYLNGAKKVVQLLNLNLAISEENKEQNSRPMYVNPIGRLRHVSTVGAAGSNIFSYMKTGSWSLLKDEIKYEGYQILYDGSANTVVTNNILGGHVSQQDDSSPAALVQPNTTQIPIISNLQIITPITNNVAAYGSDVITNGSFTTDANWTKGSGWSIANDKATFTTTGSTSDLSQNALTLSQKFTITADVTIEAGGLTMKAGSSGGTHLMSETGVYEFPLLCTGSTLIIFTASAAFSGSINSVKASGQNSITSIPIESIGTAIFKTNDVFKITTEDFVSPEFTITSDQSANDTSLSVASTNLDEDILINSDIVIDSKDLIAQYQNKTKGTVGGFDITATSIDSGSVAISSYIDDDSFGTASATSLATSESIKAYVDGQSTTTPNLQQVTDVGSTTTNSIMIGTELEFTDTTMSIYKSSNDMRFRTNNGDRLTIKNNGRIGIGTTSANAALDIQAGTADFRLTSTGQNRTALANTSTGFQISQTGNKAIYFETNGSERMRLNSTGLAIGTTSPSEKLHVVGDVKIENANPVITLTDTTNPNYCEIKNIDGSLQLRADQGDEFGNSRVRFYLDGTEKMTLSNTELNLQGSLQVGVDDTGYDVTFYGDTSGRYMLWDASDDSLQLADNTVLKIGTGLDLKLKHDGSNSFIDNSTGNINIRQFTDDGDIRVYNDDGSGGTTEYFRVDGGQEKVLFYKNSEHQDNVKAEFGNSGDLQIYHDASDSYMLNNTGDLYIRNTQDDGDIIFQSDDGSGGNATYFKIDGTNELVTFSKNVKVSDNVVINVGTNNDLQLSHNGSDSFIKTGNSSTGDLYIRQQTADADIIFQNDDGSGGNATYMTIDGSQETINFEKTVLIGTTTNTGAYKIDVAGKQRVQDTLELDDVLMLNAISTPSDPAAGKSVIYMDSSDGGIKCKINVGGTVVTRTIASFE